MEPTDIILATHNNLHLTMACVEALYKYTQNFRLTVIDDSTDLTEEYFKRFSQEKGNVNYVRPEESIRGGPYVLNIGLKLTQSDPVVYMGNSTIVEPDWLTAPLAIMERTPDCGIIGLKVIDAETRVIEQAGIYFGEPMMHHQNYGMGEPAHRFTHIREVQAVGFTCALFRRTAIPPEGLEEDYYCGCFQGMEDVDYCLQLGQRGWKVIYCGLSSVYHYAFATRGKPNQWNEEQWAIYTENRLRFLARWATWGEFEREPDE